MVLRGFFRRPGYTTACRIVFGEVAMGASTSGAPGRMVICTLGMHRSGTSVVSRILNLLGVHLGADQAVAHTGPDNPKGYWEHHPLALLNDEILARFAGQWDEPPALPPSWPRDPRLADLREKARRLLTEDFAAEPVWGWKDPRTCLTIPFWQDLIGSISYVICVRNPCAVVASLSLRDGMSAEKAERLWLTHVQSSLAGTSGQRRMFVFYEDIMDDWAPELRRMAAFIGHPERAEDPRVHALVGEFLEKGLCHHRMSMEDLAGNPRISFAAKGLYLTLRGHAPRATAGDDVFRLDRANGSVQKTLDLFGAWALETWGRTVSMTAQHDVLARENQAQAATIEVLSAERSRLAAEGGALAEKALALSAECHELAVRESRLLQSTAILESNLRSVTLERDGQARESEAAVQALQEIRASFAWRLVTFSRHVIVGLLPAGTRRRRVFNAVLRRIAPRADIDPLTT
jgi:hypothetical protein